MASRASARRKAISPRLAQCAACWASSARSSGCLDAAAATLASGDEREQIYKETTSRSASVARWACSASRYMNPLGSSIGAAEPRITVGGELLAKREAPLAMPWGWMVVLGSGSLVDDLAQDVETGINDVALSFHPWCRGCALAGSQSTHFRQHLGCIFVYIISVDPPHVGSAKFGQALHHGSAIGRDGRAAFAGASPGGSRYQTTML